MHFHLFLYLLSLLAQYLLNKELLLKLDSLNYNTLQAPLLHRCTHGIASYNSHASFLFITLTHQIHLHTPNTLLLETYIL